VLYHNGRAAVLAQAGEVDALRQDSSVAYALLPEAAAVVLALNLIPFLFVLVHRILLLLNEAIIAQLENNFLGEPPNALHKS
jgi:hypothetical protein